MSEAGAPSPEHDCLQRFMLQGAPVRGEFVSLDAAWREIAGRFVVTLDPRSSSPNRQPYLGIVPFEGDSVAEVLERYMARSEQVPTRLWLAADDSRATGLLLQRLPEEGGKSFSPSQVASSAGPSASSGVVTTESDTDGWNRMQKLAQTLSRDEMLALSGQSILHRLFWQERLHAFDSRTPRFGCTCSREKVANMLRMLGREEVASIVAEKGVVGVRCDFCNTPYDFDAVDSAELFVSEPIAPGSQVRH